jgi:hypothetical protein
MSQPVEVILDDEKFNRMLAKIRALLAKAENSAASAEEAEAYFEKAAELMARYGIERAMLADAEPETDRPGGRTIHIEGAYAVDQIGLLNAIAGPLNLQAVRLRDGRRIANIVQIYGYESDLDRAEMLFTSLLLQGFNGMKRGRPEPGESLKGYRKTWLMGFSEAVERRLKDAEARARGEAPVSASGRSAELVLADRASVVLALFKREHPDTSSSTRKLWGSGFDAGEAAGNAADLGASRVRGRTRRTLSGDS